MKVMYILLLSLFCIGCDTYSGPMGYHPDDRIEDVVDTQILDVYCDNCTIDEEGNLMYQYTGFDYGQIDFYVSNTDNHTLVGWTSPHEYCVDHWGEQICEPVINYQTYSDESGYGHQNFYMNETFKGSTLRLIGYINEDIWDEVYITIY